MSFERRSKLPVSIFSYPATESLTAVVHPEILRATAARYENPYPSTGRSK